MGHEQRRREQEKRGISGYLDLGLDDDGKQVVICWPNVITLEVTKQPDPRNTECVITFAAGPKLTVRGDQAERFLITVGLWEAEKPETPPLIISPNDEQVRISSASKDGRQ